MAKREKTVKEITALKPDKRAQITVSTNLIIEVNPVAGTKRWRYRFTNEAGKPEWYKGEIGMFPAVSLADAKAKRNELMLIRNPNKELLEQEASAKVEKTNDITFSSVAEEWYEYYQNTVEEITAKHRFLDIKNHIDKISLGKMALKDITTLDISNYLLTLNAPMGGIVKSLYNRIFSFAVEERGYIKYNVVPQRTLLKHTNHTVKKYPGITDEDELRTLINSIKLFTLKDKVAGYSLQFLLHCFTRPINMRKLKWCDVDMVNKTIHIKRTKNNHPFNIPMSPYVTSIFRNLRNERLGDKSIEFNENEYVFYNKKYNSLMPEGYPCMYLHKINIDTSNQHCAHGFRTTFSTIFHKKFEGFDIENDKYPFDMIELTIDHTAHRSRVSRIYNENDYFEERKKILKCWSNYITKL